MFFSLLPLKVLPNQMTHPGYDPALIHWVHSAESESGYCVVKDEGARIFYHLVQDGGCILYPVKADGHVHQEGAIVDPIRQIAIFKEDTR